MSKEMFHSFYPATTISAYRIVTMATATANTVKLAAATTEIPIGVSTDDCLDTAPSMLPVQVGGIVKVYFNDSVGSGQLVQTDSAGRGVLFASVSTGGYVIGTLIGPKVNTTGTIAEVLWNPFWQETP